MNNSVFYYFDDNDFHNIVNDYIRDNSEFIDIEINGNIEDFTDMNGLRSSHNLINANLTNLNVLKENNLAFSFGNCTNLINLNISN